MAIRIAINGFGRIGRMVYRASISHPEVDIVAVNDLTDTKTLAHLFKYDSVQDTFLGTVEARPDKIVINGKEITVFAEKDPIKLPWKDLNIDCVIESTGFFTKRKLAMRHITAGAKKVLVSAPCKCDVEEEPVKTIVLGVNEHIIDKEKDLILSNASCTTNCAAPIFKVLNDNFKITRGYLTTVHAYTADQRLVDAP
ncbi:MAG: type I glyceraldehyde-3-phosphate dehydrogenase, partial [Nanoarchaeota archaeon]|nr:type I glyceraldehyde-3-phosphate dehydrogenase [Nanoarchaeota archaeon]